MAEEESESIIFSNEEGAFDRAGFNESIKNLTVTKEDAQANKSAKAVGKEAYNYYKKTRSEILKEEDPGYDRAKIEYKLAYMEKGPKLRYQNIIDDGGSIDSAKDIDPEASRDAMNFLRNVNSIKNSSALEVSSLVSLNDLDDTDAYDSIEDELRDKFKENDIDTKLSLRELIKQVRKLSNRYQPERVSKPMIDMLNKPDNKFGISVVAKILESEGLKTNKSISAMSERYEKNLEEFISSLKGKDAGKEFKDIVDNKEKVEPATESKESEDTSDGGQTEKSSESISDTLEDPEMSVEGTVTKEELKEPDAEKESIESVKEDISPEGNAEMGDIETEVVTGEETLESVKEGEGTENIEKVGQTKKNKKTKKESSSIDRVTQPLSDPASKETDTIDKAPTTKKGIADLLLSAISGKGKKGRGIVNKAKEKIKEKINKKSETFNSSSPIKETKIQNLNSRPTPNKQGSVENNSESLNEKITETEKNETVSTSSEGNNTSSNEQSEKISSASNKNAEEKTMDVVNLENKMDTMISLLSDVSETLQGPLVVKSSDRVYN